MNQPRTRRRPDRRRDIIRAAEQLFRTRRFHEITLDEVARRARVGKGTIYLYFKDKDELFFQTATEGFEELCARLQQNLCAVPFLRQLREAAVLITRFFASRRQIFRMLVESGGPRPNHAAFHQRAMEHRQRLVAVLATVLRQGVAEGAVRQDVPAETLAAFLLGMLHTRSIAPAGPDPNLAGGPVETVIELFCNGACPGAARAVRRPRATHKESHSGST